MSRHTLPEAVLVLVAIFGWLWPVQARTDKNKAPVSEDSQTCIGCHSQVTPGIVASWRRSMHAHVTPLQAMKKDEMHGGLTSRDVPVSMQGHVVGCAECHTLNPKAHSDTFEHNGFQVHVVVTPKDCATCHKKEVDQFENSVMAKAYVDLMGNPTYTKLVSSVNGMQHWDKGKLTQGTPKNATNEGACLQCHGTKVTVVGTSHRETDMGDMDFPKLTGWPNAGVGRINPDGSTGSCTACHTRHSFSVSEARSPEACERCHKGPDVPAYKVYTVSKHGALYKAHHHDWHMGELPWVAGRDFDAPTCATCHMSGVLDTQGKVLATRTHDVGSRLDTRIFGLPYSHPQPVVADTSRVKNKAGLYLITNLDGTPVKDAVIGRQERKKRRKRMQATCLACHSQSWVQGHFKNLDHMDNWADKMVKTGTTMIAHAWKTGVASPENPFDEYIEKLWVESWLFYANSVRFAAAMAGADYGVFAHGAWYLSRTITQIRDFLDILEQDRARHIGKVISH